MSRDEGARGRKDTAPSRPSVNHRASAGPYVVVWALLVVLTLTNFATSRLDLGRYALAVALVIGGTQASVVALYFMHLKDHGGAIRLVVATCVVFFLTLVGLTQADVARRFLPARPFENVHGPSPTLFPPRSAELPDDFPRRAVGPAP